ncbi:MAG: hypothetical protein AB1644_03410 [Candidatus Zixiibacteriota bacterium]
MTSLLFFQHFAADPYFNMAFDEWLMTRSARSPLTILLRLYTWREGAITFGYNQRQDTALDFTRIGTTPVIRRITGGRALYHDPSELTYAIAMDLSGSGAAVSGSRASAIIAEALRSFLEWEGVAADYVRTSHRQNSRPEFFHKAPCFASAARYELMRGEQKIVASAQRRTGEQLLQHGSIKLRGVARHPALMLSEQCEGTVPQPVDSGGFDVYAEHFAHSFAERFGVQMRLGTLAGTDLAEVAKMAGHLRKNPLEQRETLKQNPGFNSL